jgi:CheY-like chemotaxis protein
MAGGRGLSDETPPADDGSLIVRRATAPGPRRRLGRPLTDVELLAEIGRELRSVYSELLREPIPEHLAVIIERLEPRTDTHRPEETAMAHAENTARVALVVEDDPDVRSLAAALIEETDLDVVEEDSAEGALAYLRRHAEEVALVFADIRLRRMDGIELARIVKRDWPWIRVLVTSGNPGDRLEELPRGARYMQKPWRALDVLIEAERAAAA